jgi:hypothetical protein
LIFLLFGEKMTERLLTGWRGRGGRPFTKSEFDRTHLKKNTKMSYQRYLNEYGRQKMWMQTGAKKTVTKKQPTRKTCPKSRTSADFSSWFG